MRPETQVGELIATQSAKVAKAEAVLGEQRSPFGRVQYFLWFFGGLAIGATMSVVPKYGVWFVGATTGAGFYMATQAFRECIDLRRRLDAAIVLLRSRGEL